MISSSFIHLRLNILQNDATSTESVPLDTDIIRRGQRGKVGVDLVISVNSHTWNN